MIKLAKHIALRMTRSGKLSKARIMRIRRQCRFEQPVTLVLPGDMSIPDNTNLMPWPQSVPIECAVSLYQSTIRDHKTCVSHPPPRFRLFAVL